MEKKMQSYWNYTHTAALETHSVMLCIARKCSRRDTAAWLASTVTVLQLLWHFQCPLLVLLFLANQLLLTVLSLPSGIKTTP